MFRLSIVTPEKVFYEDNVISLIVPGTEGYLGVLSHHAPLITALKPGKIEFRDASDYMHVLAVSGGFLEVSGNQATLLADAVERADEIDVARAQAALDREKKRLMSFGKGETEIDLPRAQSGLERAANRLKIAREHGSH
jgi:F-type H+-transporting ATPase subunit epsilon